MNSAWGDIGAAGGGPERRACLPAQDRRAEDLGRGDNWPRDASDALEERTGALLALGGGQGEAPEAEVQPHLGCAACAERRSKLRFEL